MLPGPSAVPWQGLFQSAATWYTFCMPTSGGNAHLQDLPGQSVLLLCHPKTLIPKIPKKTQTFSLNIYIYLCGQGMLGKPRTK